MAHGGLPVWSHGPGREHLAQGSSLKGGHCNVIGGAAVLHGLPSSFPVALTVPQIGQLLRNTPSFGTTFNTVLMRRLCLVLNCQHSGSLANSTCVRLWPKPTLVCRREPSCFWVSSCRKIQWLCRQTDKTPQHSQTHHPPTGPAAPLHGLLPTWAPATVYLSSCPKLVTQGERSSHVWSICLKAGTVLGIFTFIDLFSNTRNAYHYGWEWAHYRGENTESWNNATDPRQSS